MNKIELKNYFLHQLENGDIYLKIGFGRAFYKMSHGSFKTKDKVKDDHLLKFQNKQGKEYLFADKKISCVIAIDELEGDIVKLHFKCNNPEYNRFLFRFKSFEDEHIYGCGEQYSHFDLKGQKVDIWVSEHQQVLKILDKFLREKLTGVNPDYNAPYKWHQTYYSSPSFVSSKNYFVYCHEDAYGQLRFEKDETFIGFRQIPQSISFIFADSPIELASKVTRFVNIQPHLPDFVSSGAIIASQGGSKPLLERYEKLKNKGGKISAVWCQDWSGQIITKFGSQVYWNWSLDESLYEDFQLVRNKLAKDGVKFLGYINTFLKEDAPLYLEAKEKGYLVKKQDGSVYHIQSTTFDAGIVDLTNPEAYDWYKGIIRKNMIDIGLDGWMADFGEYLPTDAVVYGGDAERLHNKWPTLWAKVNYDAIKEAGKEGEIFIFSRAAYGHTIQYTNSMWNGDQHVDFSDEYGLGSVIPSSLSMSCSGVGVIHSDIGGYTTVLHMKRDQELFLRWAEMNIFTPVYRTHEGNRPLSNVQFHDDSVIDNFAKYTQLFVDLKPYRDDVLKEYYEQGLPTIRPLFYHFNEEKAYTNKREYLFGEELLVAPVIRKNKEKQHIYLPKGQWVDLLSEKEYEGGDELVEVDCPIGHPQAFYLKGCKHEQLFKQIKENYKL